MDYFDYGLDPVSVSGWNAEFDIEAFLEQTQAQEQQRLEQELTRIEEQLEQREVIHEQTVNELESKLEWYIDRLKALYRQNTGKHGERQQLKDRIETFYQELRSEQRSLWRDQQELEQERREVLQELEELTLNDWLTQFL